MLTLLFSILVIAIVVYALHLLISFLGLPAPLATICYLIIAAIVLFWLAGQFGIIAPHSLR